MAVYDNGIPLSFDLQCLEYVVNHWSTSIRFKRFLNEINVFISTTPISELAALLVWIVLWSPRAMLSSFDIWFRTIQGTCLRVWLFIDIQAGKLALIFPSVLDEGRLIDKETFVF